MLYSIAALLMCIYWWSLLVIEAYDWSTLRPIYPFLKLSFSFVFCFLRLALKNNARFCTFIFHRKVMIIYLCIYFVYPNRSCIKLCEFEFRFCTLLFCVSFFALETKICRSSGNLLNHITNNLQPKFVSSFRPCSCSLQDKWLIFWFWKFLWKS